MSQLTPTLATAQSFAPAPRAPAYRWLVVILLFLATTINYMDRQVLGLLKDTYLQKEFNWTETDYSNIVVAFQAAYGLGMLGFGYLIDRWGTKRGYSISIIIWSLAATAHAAATGVMGFGAARFVLGLGEAGNFPAAVKTVAEWFPKRERSLATGLFNCGSNVGAIAAPAVVPWLALAHGWQMTFIALGVSGFFWLALWLAFYSRPEASPYVNDEQMAYLRDEPVQGFPVENAPLPSAEIISEAAAVPIAAAPNRVGWFQLFAYRQAWANNFQSMLVAPIWWFLLFWLPSYYTSRYGLNIKAFGAPLIMVYSMSLVGSIIGGFLPGIFLRAGCSLNVSRKCAMLICAALTIPLVFVVKIDDKWIATGLIGLAMAAMQGWSANSYTMVSDLFPKRAVASVVGMGSAAGALGAIVFAKVAGYVLDFTHNDYLPLFIAAGLSFPMALLVIHLLAPRWEPAALDD